MQIEQGKFPSPPGIVSTLAAGFDAVANHIGVILPPLLLDLFLWWGPHLGFKTLRPQVLSAFALISRGSPLDQIAAERELLDHFLSNFNLFSVLRTFPIGSPSLLSFSLTTQSPWGVPLTWDAGPMLAVIGWACLLVAAGWVFGALYYHWVAGVTLQLGTRSMWNSIWQSIILLLIWMVVFLIFGFPVLFVLSAVVPLGAGAMQVMLILTGILLGWALMLVFFSAHGIFAYQQDAFRSFFNSLRIARFALRYSALFLLLSLLIGQGLKFLWRTPPANSWWLLIGIAGHAFVSTALLAASFVYYRDINAWLKAVFEQIQKQTSSAQV